MLQILINVKGIGCAQLNLDKNFISNAKRRNTHMSKVAIIVEFETVPEKHAQWVALIRAHAKMYLKKEPECLRFELHFPIDEHGHAIPNRLLVNELYANETIVAKRKLNPYIVKIYSMFEIYAIKVRYMETVVE